MDGGRPENALPLPHLAVLRHPPLDAVVGRRSLLPRPGAVAVGDVLAGVEEVVAAAEVHHLRVVEDAARALGAMPADRRDGSGRQPLEGPKRMSGLGDADAAESGADGQAFVREV